MEKKNKILFNNRGYGQGLPTADCGRAFHHLLPRGASHGLRLRFALVPCPKPWNYPLIFASILLLIFTKKSMLFPTKRKHQMQIIVEKEMVLTRERKS